MDKTLEQIRSYAEQGGGRIICHRAEYGPRFFVFRAEKASEVLRVDPKKMNSYVGVVNQPPPKWSSVKKVRTRK